MSKEKAETWLSAWLFRVYWVGLGVLVGIVIGWNVKWIANNIPTPFWVEETPARVGLAVWDVLTRPQCHVYIERNAEISIKIEAMLDKYGDTNTLNNHRVAKHREQIVENQAKGLECDERVYQQKLEDMGMYEDR